MVKTGVRTLTKMESWLTVYLYSGLVWVKAQAGGRAAGMLDATPSPRRQAVNALKYSIR